MTDEQSVKLSLFDRAYVAWKTFRGQPMHFNPYGFGGGINYGGTFLTAGGPTFGGPGFSAGRMAGTDINYLREVGDLTQSSLVMAAVNWMGRTFNDAPIAVAKEEKDGSYTIEVGHDLPELWKYPNPYYTCSQMTHAMALSWILNGNIYILKRRDMTGRVAELWWLPHWMVRPRWDPTDDQSYLTHYDYHVGQMNYELAVEDVIHLKNGIDPHYDRCGLAPLLSLLREIYSDIEVMNYMALLARAGGVPPYILTPKDGVTGAATDPKNIKEKMIRATSGDRRGQMNYIPVGLDLKVLGFEPQKMDLTALHRIPEERLASVIGIPASTLGFGGIKDDPTYANAAQADKRAYNTFSVPLWTAFGLDFTKHLLHSDFSDDPTYSVIFDLTKVQALQEDEDKRHARYREDAAKGLITVHQFQVSTGYADPDETAKYYLIPGRVMPVTSEAALRQAQEGVFSTANSETGLLEDADPELAADAAANAPAPPRQLGGKIPPKPKQLPAAPTPKSMKKLTDDELAAARSFWQAVPGNLTKLWDARNTNGNGAH